MQVSDQIIKVLDAISEKIGVAIDWSSNNILPYLQQLYSKYITYKLSLSTLLIILGIFIIFFGVLLEKRLRKNKMFGVVEYKTLSNDYINRYMAYVGIYFIYFIGILIILLKIITIITCLTFPEKYIIDELLPLVK